MTVDVSVIIPTYNRKDFLIEAIESVLAQTFLGYELIVVDDGSTDGTKKVLADYGNKITYYFQENKGVSSARNFGIQKSHGRFICFLDSDDLWLKDKLKIQYDFMINHPDSFISYTDEIWIRKGVRVNPKKKHAKYSGWIFERSLPLCIISPSSVMIKRELFDIVGLFDERFPVCEDYDLWLRITSKFPVSFINKKLIIKRGGHSDQLSQKSWGNDRYRVFAIVKLLNSNQLSSEQRKQAILELKKKCAILANGFRKREKIKEAIYYETMAKRFS